MTLVLRLEQQGFLLNIILILFLFLTQGYTSVLLIFNYGKLLMNKREGGNDNM